MPAWTLATLLSETTASLGNRADLTLSRVSFLVNEAYRQVAEATDHNRTEQKAITSTASGDACVNLPTDFYELINLSNLSASPHDILQQMDVNNADSQTTALGVPKYYVSYATFLELVPSPDSTYSIQLRYRAELSDMTLTTATPSVSTRYHYAIALKSRELCAEAILDRDKASAAHNAYVQYMQSVPSDQALRMRKDRTLAVSLLWPRRSHR